ncbi:MAG: helix-turn-helix transcriptional regulator [Planctomycetes bacterium]|nr:helix-turn-helix transcriptional regulator [Planctomycetota bacterium]
MLEEEGFCKEVGLRIRQARSRANLTQEDLGDAVKLTRTSITNIERGRQRLLVLTLAKIAEALRVAPSTLIPDNPVRSDVHLNRALKDRSPSERKFIEDTIRSAIAPGKRN